MLDGKKWVPANEELIQSILTPDFIDQLDSLPKDKKIINGITYEGTFIGDYMIYGKKTYEDGRTKSGFFDKEHRLKTKLSPLTVAQSAIDVDGAGQIVQG